MKTIRSMKLEDSYTNLRKADYLSKSLTIDAKYDCSSPESRKEIKGMAAEIRTLLCNIDADFFRALFLGEGKKRDIQKRYSSALRRSTGIALSMEESLFQDKKRPIKQIDRFLLDSKKLMLDVDFIYREAKERAGEFFPLMIEVQNDYNK